MLSQAKLSYDILWITTGPGDVEYCLVVSIKAMELLKDLPIILISHVLKPWGKTMIYIFFCPSISSKGNQYFQASEIT